MNNQELSDIVEKAAEKGARKGASKGSRGVWSTLLFILVIAGLLYGTYMAFNQAIDSKFGVVDSTLEELKGKVDEAFKTEEAAEEHDVVLDDDGIWGYLAADIEDAVLGDAEAKSSLLVLRQSVTDTVNILDTGLANLKMFSKKQFITYRGYAPYFVDLSKLGDDSFDFDKDSRTVTIYIPHAGCSKDDITIPKEEIEFGETVNGLLSFGEVKLTPETYEQVRAEAMEKMMVRLDEMNTAETADSLARLAVYDIYAPLINKIDNTVSLRVEVR